jgi:hypothetical protein
MNVALALLVLATMGVNSTWQPVADRPASHTAQYTPSDSGWSSDDRYSSNPYNTTATTTQPPTITSRVQGAAVETGTTLRDGIEAGIQAAGQQIERTGGQLLQRSTNVGQGVGRQLQDLTAGAGRQLEYTGDNLRNAAGQTVGAARDTLGAAGEAVGIESLPPLPELGDSSALSLPPWPSDTSSAENSATGSSTVSPSGPNSQAAGASPPLWNSPTAATTRSTTVTPPASDDRYRTSPTTPASSDWRLDTVGRPATTIRPSDAAAGWDVTGSSQATIGRQSSQPGLVPIQPQPAGPRQPAPPATDRWADSWSGNDPWAQPSNQPSQPAPPSQPTATAAAPAQGAPWPNTTPTSNQSLDGWGDDRGTSPSTATSGDWTGGPAPTGVATSQNQPATQPPQPQQQPAATPPNSASSPAPAAVAAAPLQTAPADVQPWMPLMLVSFGLAGSIGANLFLGWSYMEARHRYSSLARKTADMFKRTKDLAA